jgi:acetyltransferase-like isoleucine patch superfamily enzyme
MNLFDRIFWLLIRRNILSRRGIRCHYKAYCSKDSVLGDYIELLGNALVWNSTVKRFTKIVQSKLVSVDVGAFCSIAEGCKIGGAGRHPIDQVSTHKAFYCPNENFEGLGRFTEHKLFDDSVRRVNIGNDVWIGQHCLILEGVTIGTGAIIAAGAVVTKDVDPYAIVGGIPAKFIRYRHDEELREALLKSEWWSWPIKNIMQISSIFNANEPLTVEKWDKFFKSLSKETV